MIGIESSAFRPRFVRGLPPVPSISSTLPAPTYLALPAPGSATLSAPGSATLSRVRPEAPVEPVQPVKRRQDQAGTSGQAGDRSAATAAAQGRGAAANSGTGATAASTAPGHNPGTPARASTGFVTQRLSQESLGSGLHIEPWSAALSSYRSAAALPGSATRNPGVVV